MPKSLLEELLKIAAEGRREAQHILERINSGTRIGLQLYGATLEDICQQNRVAETSVVGRSF